MTLIFIGHGFKYELEAVCKLFFPVQTFSFAFLNEGDPLPDTEGDFCVLSRFVEDKTAKMSVKAVISGRELYREKSLNTDIPDYEHRCELTLCGLLFNCLKDITGVSPEWGMLTGVRPVKLVTRLKNGGADEKAIYERLKKELFVSDEKIRLACATADNQREAVKNLPERSVSLYVSIPFCPSRCAYCSFVSQTVSGFKKLMPEYVDKLCRELEYIADALNLLSLGLDTVYFGGGTPTSLEASDLERIMKTVSRRFDLSKLREYTVEAGRPDTVTPEKLAVIKDNGGDRVSVNPQTLHDGVLEAIGRKHTVAQFYEAYELAKKAGFKAVNVDLIAGLPTDSFEGFCDSLTRVIGLDPENITVHALSIKRAADLMQSGGEGLSSALTSRMTAFSNAALLESGYSPYYLYRQKNQLGNQENVGWEKGGNVGIYNVNMMEEIQTVLAAGAGGSTKIVAAADRIQRLYNPKYPLEYIKRFEETVIPRKDEAREKMAEILSRGGRLTL